MIPSFVEFNFFNRTSIPPSNRITFLFLSIFIAKLVLRKTGRGKGEAMKGREGVEEERDGEGKGREGRGRKRW